VIFIESFHLKLGLKIGLFHLKLQKKHIWPAPITLGALSWTHKANFHAPEAWQHALGRWQSLRTHGSTLGAHQCNFQHEIACFFSFFWVFYVLGLRNITPPFVMSYETSWIFIHGLSEIFTSLHDVLFCRFAWFLLEFHQNTLELLCFKKSRIHDSNRKHNKMSRKS